jgi:hypothetical protein
MDDFCGNRIIGIRIIVCHTPFDFFQLRFCERLWRRFFSDHAGDDLLRECQPLMRRHIVDTQLLQKRGMV